MYLESFDQTLNSTRDEQREGEPPTIDVDTVCMGEGGDASSRGEVSTSHQSDC